MQGSVTQLFEDVRRAYFPRWDRKRRWTCQVGIAPGTRRGSFCDRRLKAIYISPEDAASPNVQAIIIHEITHAVAWGDHGAAFQHRESVAADRATALGDKTLASQIRKDIEVCRRCPPCATAEEVYSLVRDVVVMDRIREYEQVLEAVSNEYVTTPEEFEKYHPRTRKVFEKALREAEKEDRLRAQFLASRQVEAD